MLKLTDKTMFTVVLKLFDRVIIELSVIFHQFIKG